MKASRVALRGVLAWTTLAAIIASCSEQVVNPGDSSLVRLALQPSPREIDDGASTQISVFGVEAGGRQVALPPANFSVVWSSSDNNVLRVTASGTTATVEAVSPGRATVTVEATPLTGVARAATAGNLRVSAEILAMAVPTELMLTSPNNISGAVNTALPDSVSLRVLDRRGAGVSGVQVMFEVVEGGGSLSRSSALTDAGGYARTSWRLGPAIGRNKMRGRTDRPNKQVDIDANGTTSEVARVDVLAGNGQQGTVGSNLPIPVSVRVTDSQSRPLPGVAVTWTVLTGGGTITPQVAPTDAQGISAVSWTMGTISGTQTARAAVGNLTASFTVSARAAAPSRLVKLAGDAQSAAVNTRLTDSLGVQVVDGYGNPVPGVTVNWSVQSGGGSVSPAANTTGAGGIARAAWTMGPAAGAGAARASVTGVGEVTFSATATAGPPPPPPPPPPANQIVKLSGDAQSAPIATALTDSVAVTVRNSQGQGVPDVTVTWTVTSGGGSVSPTTRVTDQNGVARTKWTMGPAVGSATLKATAPNSGEVNFTATATSGTGGTGQLTITKISGDAQTGTTSTRLGDSLVVQVKDAQGTGVSGVNVTWSVQSGGGSVSPAIFTTNASGFARTAWTLGSTAGAGSVSANAPNATAPITFTATANAPAPTVARVAVSPQADTIRALNAQVTLSATAYDPGNQPIPGTRFTWSSLNPTIAMVDTMGVVTAKAAGRALIVAAAVCCSEADTALIDVILPPGPPGTPQVATANINADTFQVTARWAKGSTAVRYDWATGASSGTWNRSGQVTDSSLVLRVPRTTGSDYWFCVYSVNSEGTRSDSQSCGAYVAPTTGGVPAPVASVTVTPSSPSIAVGATAQLTATLRDAGNNILTGRTVTWSSGNAAFATVNSTSGLVTGVAIGSATITATSEGQTGTAVVTVAAAPPPPTVTGINVSPATVNLLYGQTQQFTASATLSNGGIQSNANVTWSGTGGSVNASGLYAAGSTAGTFRVIATGSGFADTANVSISAPPPPGTDNKYFNSAEVGCGTDSNVLLCDDFEDGDWYPIHCDASGNAGRTDAAARADGWCGSIYSTITPPGAADCSGAIGALGRCAATSGALTGSVGGKLMAEHALANDQEVQEVYIRWYYKPSVGFSWGPQKILSVNRCCNSGGIYWAGLGYNIGEGASSTSPPDMGITNNRLDADPALPGNTTIWRLNISGYSPTGGRWSYYEMHIKLNTPGQSDGVWEFWANDCGTSAAGCTGTPTLRARHTNVNWGKTSTNGGIGSLWWENWANPGAIGTEFYDQIKVSKVPVGFAH